MASQKKSKNTDSSPFLPSGFGGYLRSLRAQRELTLREVAAVVGMDQAHLSKAELGQRLPTPAQVRALARFFHEDLVEFEARCIAEKFRRRHAGSAAAIHAVRLLHGEQTGTAAARTGGRVSEGTVRPTAARPPSPPPPRPPETAAAEENPGVIVLHVD